MKYFFIAALALLVTGCAKNTNLEFDGTAPGITNGTFMIKDVDKDSVVCQAPIKDEKFSLSQPTIAPGYYYLQVANPGKGVFGFDVYLEQGKYTITTNREQPYKYPEIQSASKIQNELSAYYHTCDTVSERLINKASAINAQLKDPKSKQLSPAAYAELQDKLKAADQEAMRSRLIALSTFVDKFPDNVTAPRTMMQGNIFTTDPKAYYQIYQKLNPAAQNSPQGLLLKKFLTDLLNPPAK